MIQDSQSLPIELAHTHTHMMARSPDVTVNFFVPRIEAANRGLGTTGQKGGREGDGYLVSRIIKAGDPLGFVYVAEGPGRGWMERREKREG